MEIHTLFNTVGIFLSGLLVSLITARFFVLRKGILRRCFLFLGCGLLGSMIIYFSDWANLPPALLAFLLAVWFGCEGSPLKRLTVGLLLASTVFAGNALWDNYTIVQSTRILCRLAFLSLLYLGTGKLALPRDFELKNTLWKLFLLLSLTPLGIVTSVILLGNNTQKLLQTALTALSACSFAGLLLTMKVLFEQGKLEEERLMAEQNRKYYEAVEQQSFEIRRLKHDLANHLQTLRTLPHEEAEDYIEELLGSPSLTKTLRYCGDRVVNAVLTAKASVMEQKGITFHVRAELPAELPMEMADVCALFGNALDNAIEAVEKLSPEQRRVNLECRFAKGMFALSAENPCLGAEGKPGAFPPTTKKEKNLHGYGLRSMERIAEKYGGRLEIRTEEKVFKLFFYCSF